MTDSVGASIAEVVERTGRVEVLLEIDGNRYVGDVIGRDASPKAEPQDTHDYRCTIRTDGGLDIKLSVTDNGYGWIGERAAFHRNSSVVPDRSSSQITRVEPLN